MFLRIAPRHAPPSPAVFERPTFRHDLEWELFHQRGSLDSHLEAELRTAFRSAVLAGLLPIA